jgi:hypothetical protein
MNYTKPYPKQEYPDDSDHRTYREKAIDVAGKIACLIARGRCSFCGRICALTAHHIVHRSYSGTCALIENLLPLCEICHADCHRDEKRFKAWLEQLKPGHYQKMWEIARPVCTLVFSDVYEALLIQYHSMLVEQQKTHHTGKMNMPDQDMTGDGRPSMSDSTTTK